MPEAARLVIWDLDEVLWNKSTEGVWHRPRRDREHEVSEKEPPPNRETAQGPVCRSGAMPAAVPNP
jgi:hypothetical protein